MPSDYVCGNCRLSFSLGWFHYHECDTHWASTLLACGSCGTRHTINHATPEGLRKERSDLDRILRPEPVGDELWAALNPSFRPLDEDKNDRWLDGTGKVEWITPWTWEQLSLDTQDMNIDEILGQLVCHYCEGDGTLVKEWPNEGAQCPSCNEVIKDSVAFWVT